MTETANIPITLAYGNGIGPEVMEAAVRILREAEVRINMDITQVGETMYERGHSFGISVEGQKSMQRTGILFEGPTLLPDDNPAYKAMIPTLRRSAGLYAQAAWACVPELESSPLTVASMDILAFRPYAPLPLEEDDQPAPPPTETAKSDTIHRFVSLLLDWATRLGRSHITLITGDTDALNRDSALVEALDLCIKDHDSLQLTITDADSGLARLVTQAHTLDVVVGDTHTGPGIMSTLQAIAGAQCMAGSAHIGPELAIFQPLHKAHPELADQDIANPTGAILTALLMLTQLERTDTVTMIQTAWRDAIRSGALPAALCTSPEQEPASTTALTDAIVSLLHPNLV